MRNARAAKVERALPMAPALVFLVALNLRPALSAVGPLLPEIGSRLGLAEGTQGVLGALPLVGFGLISSVVHHASRRLGIERTVLLSLMALVAGIVVRSYCGEPGLWVGTITAGCAIAVGNVLLPAIVRRDYSAHISRATSIYSACITVSASIGSAVAVPLSTATDWNDALAFWAIPALIVLVLWLPRALPAAPYQDPRQAGNEPAASLWRQPTAWLVTAFMGLQSTTFYIMATWLPTIEVAAGVSARQAGLRLFLYQLVGVVSGLAIPRLMWRHGSQAAAVTASAPMLVGVLGILLVPALSVAWIIVAGLGSGAALVVALSLISLRGGTPHETARLSGMAQSLGYLLASTGPFLAGHLTQRTGTWTLSLILLAGLGVTQLLVAVPAGRERKLTNVR
ncbi:MAG: MFS transporter [Acidimicrobiaceae bacterium]|nr:MFS transporter [Acidimicrobiaceae bacterium]